MALLSNWLFHHYFRMDMEKHEVDLFVIEDNEVFCRLLVKDLERCVEQMYIRSRFDVNICSYVNSEAYMDSIKNKGPVNNDTIAFIDYYLGNGVNGVHILKLLKDHYKNLQVVLMSRLPQVKDKINNKVDENINLHFIVKDEYTPAVCRIFLENYLENLY